MGGIATLIGVISTVAGAVNDYQTAKFQAKEAEGSAKLAEINADIARKDGLVAQAKAAEEAHRALGRQRAAQAQGGILGSATGEMLLDQAEAEAREDQLNIGYQAARNVQGLLVEAQNKRNDAALKRQGAGHSAVRGGLSVLGSVARPYGG